MSFLPLTLGVGHATGTGGGGAKPPSKAASEKILKEDDFTCRFCGFKSAQYQRVIPFNGDYVTCCSFCEQVSSLERAGLMGSGLLIWLPEVTQAELNHIARAIYIAKASENNEFADVATRAVDALISRRSEVKKRLGTDDPLVLATTLQESLTPEERKLVGKKLDGVRLLPLDKHMVRSHGRDINGFPQMIKYWCSPEGPFSKFPTSEWKKLFAKIPK